MKKLLLFLLAALALAGCKRPPKPPLVFGATAWPGYESIYLARSQGFLPKQGIVLERFADSAQLDQAVRAHKVHLAAVTLSQALLLRRDIPDLKIVLVLDASSGADALLAQADIHSLAQLQGKRIVAENALRGAYFMDLAARETGVSARRFDVKSMSAGDQEAAFRARKVDALVAGEPLRSRLLAAGAKQIFDSSRLPGKLLDVLVIRDDDIGRYNPEMLQLLKAWRQSVDFIRLNPAKAVAAMAQDENAEPSQFGQAMQGVELYGLRRNRELLLSDPPAVSPAIDGLQRFMLNSGLMQVGMDSSALLDTSLLDNIGR
jgi:NitT/TauT family transport system substrate-binding protein